MLLKTNYLYWVGNTIERIANTLKDADLVICHSNGANYCMKALRKICNKDIKMMHTPAHKNVQHPPGQTVNPVGTPDNAVNQDKNLPQMIAE